MAAAADTNRHKGHSKEIYQAHPPMPEKIDATTYPLLMRELWAPSYEMAQDAVKFLFDKLDWALTERRLAGDIVPFGIDTGLQVAFDVANLNFSNYDRRADVESFREPADEEPISYFKDSYIPKNAAFRSDYTGIHHRSLQGQQSANRFSIPDDQRSHTIRTKRGAQSIIGKDIDETSGLGGRTESTGNRTIEQVTLQPGEPKEWEKLTKQEEYELEFMRLNQQKKEALRFEQSKKAEKRREEAELLSRESARVEGPPILGEVEMPPPEQPVKVDKLPVSFRSPFTKLDIPTQATRDNDYARIIKKLQQSKLQAKRTSPNPSVKDSITLSTKSQVSLDPLNMIKTSGINDQHKSIPKLVLQEPISKYVKPFFGVNYKEPKVAMDGEPYESMPRSKKQLTRTQFKELASQFEPKTFRDKMPSMNTLGEDLSKYMDQSPMGNLSMPHIHGLGGSQENTNIKNILSQVLPPHNKRSMHRQNQRTHIKTLSQAGLKQLFTSASSPVSFRQQQQNNSSISSITESRLLRPEGMVLPKFLPAIVSPQAAKIDMGYSPMHGSGSKRRFLRNSRNEEFSVRMDSLNDKGIYKGLSTESFGTERVFQYQAEQVKSQIMPEAQTAHDKLNLMIIRGQDPASYIDNFNTSSSAAITQSPQGKLPGSPLKPTLNDVKLKLGGNLEHPMHLQGSGYFTHRLSLAERGHRIKFNQAYEELVHIA